MEAFHLQATASAVMGWSSLSEPIPLANIITSASLLFVTVSVISTCFVILLLFRNRQPYKAYSPFLLYIQLGSGLLINTLICLKNIFDRIEFNFPCFLSVFILKMTPSMVFLPILIRGLRLFLVNFLIYAKKSHHLEVEFESSHNLLITTAPTERSAISSTTTMEKTNPENIQQTNIHSTHSNPNQQMNLLDTGGYHYNDNQPQNYSQDKNIEREEQCIDVDPLQSQTELGMANSQWNTLHSTALHSSSSSSHQSHPTSSSHQDEYLRNGDPLSSSCSSNTPTRCQPFKFTSCGQTLKKKLSTFLLKTGIAENMIKDLSLGVLYFTVVGIHVLAYIIIVIILALQGINPFTQCQQIPSNLMVNLVSISQVFIYILFLVLQLFGLYFVSDNFRMRFGLLLSIISYLIGSALVLPIAFGQRTDGEKIAGNYTFVIAVCVDAILTIFIVPLVWHSDHTEFRLLNEEGGRSFITKFIQTFDDMLAGTIPQHEKEVIDEFIKLFSAYCEKELGIENWLFFVEAKKYHFAFNQSRNSTTEMMRKLSEEATRIYETFIVDTSIYAMNISGETRNNLEKIFSKDPPPISGSIFNQALNEARENLSDTSMRFSMTREYQKFMRRVTSKSTYLKNAGYLT